MQRTKTANLSENDYQDMVTEIREKFSRFLELLEKNHQVLRLISDMEEKTQGEYLFNMNYLRSSLDQVRSGVQEIIQLMISLGGDRYKELNPRYKAIEREVNAILPGGDSIVEDDYIIPLEEVDSSRAASVGGKCVGLSELRSLGMPVPVGFSISAWAYKYFLDSNDLQSKISELLRYLDIKRLQDLTQASQIIRRLILAAKIPSDLEETIMQAYFDLRTRIAPKHVSLRSSAVGEDSFHSFAGQYETFLNVASRDILQCYKEILASKFTPQAIYYFLSHQLSETQLTMGVICLEMVNARTSGVVYTKNPIAPNDGSLLINSVFGLGKIVVEGIVTPDYFQVSRETGKILESIIANKSFLLQSREKGGIAKIRLTAKLQNQPSLSTPQIQSLCDYALQLENHYESPQDIEWAIDQEGKLYLLQCRPLRVVPEHKVIEIKDIQREKLLYEGGVTVCPGAGSGQVHVVISKDDLESVPHGVVLVTPRPFPGLITVIDRLQALVTEIGSVVSHAAIITREYQTPSLTRVHDAIRLLKGKTVTVDATAGKIYFGRLEEIIEIRKEEINLLAGMEIMRLLEAILKKISTLHLINPAEPSFTVSNCRTFHDLTRYCHQKAIEELFHSVKDEQFRTKIGCKLKTDIPLEVNILILDDEVSNLPTECEISEDQLHSIPMRAFWEGIKIQGWHKSPKVEKSAQLFPKLSLKRDAQTKQDYSTQSFAILSQDYMLLSLRMGFHFMTIESLCTKEPGNNYIRLRHKGGGSTLERRTRRIRLLSDLLTNMGFELHCSSDHLDSMLANVSDTEVKDRLVKLGRLTLMTKQLDMTLSNDRICAWYTEDFKRQLSLSQ